MNKLKRFNEFAVYLYEDVSSTGQFSIKKYWMHSLYLVYMPE